MGYEHSSGKPDEEEIVSLPTPSIHPHRGSNFAEDISLLVTISDCSHGKLTLELHLVAFSAYCHTRTLHFMV